MSSIPNEPAVDKKGMQDLFGKWVEVGWEDGDAIWGLVVRIDRYEMEVFLPGLRGMRGVEPYQIIRVGPTALPPE